MKERILSLNDFTLHESNLICEDEVNYKEDQYALVFVGGSIGQTNNYPLFAGHLMASIVKTSNDKDELVEEKKRRNKNLSPGEKKYYGMSYKVIELTNSKRKEVDYLLDYRKKSEDTTVSDGE